MCNCTGKNIPWTEFLRRVRIYKRILKKYCKSTVIMARVDKAVKIMDGGMYRK